MREHESARFGWRFFRLARFSFSRHGPMNLDDDSRVAPPVIPAARRRDAKRIVVGIAGCLALLLVSTLTLGGALVAAIGMGVGSMIARKRGKRLTRTASWVSAVAAVVIVLLGLVGFTAARLDRQAVNKEFRHAMDSVRALPPRPPPAWLKRLAPGAAARASARNTPDNPTLDAAAGIWALVVGMTMFATIAAVTVGTIGWLATLPLAYAITGRWIGSRGET
jgi:hypothetical protein